MRARRPGAIVTGVGRIQERPVAVVATDVSVSGGTIEAAGGELIAWSFEYPRKRSASPAGKSLRPARCDSRRERTVSSRSRSLWPLGGGGPRVYEIIRGVPLPRLRTRLRRNQEIAGVLTAG